MARGRGNPKQPAAPRGDVYAGDNFREKLPPAPPKVKSPRPEGTGFERHGEQTAEAGAVDWGQLGGQNYVNIGPDVARQFRYREPAAPKIGGPSTWHRGQRGR